MLFLKLVCSLSVSASQRLCISAFPHFRISAFPLGSKSLTASNGHARMRVLKHAIRNAPWTNHGGNSSKDGGIPQIRSLM